MTFQHFSIEARRVRLSRLRDSITWRVAGAISDFFGEVLCFRSLSRGNFGIGYFEVPGGSSVDYL